MFALLKICFFFVLAAFLACAQASSSPLPERDAPAQARLNSAARLISGLLPTYDSHKVIAQSPAWKHHSELMRATWTRLNTRQVTAMTDWRDAELGKGCPAGKTLMYPFSGPDFFNAYWLFPGCETIVMFGLEHIGEVPEIDAMNERELEHLLADVRASMSSFVERNYFITQNMAKQMRTSQLRGVLPIFMLAMALTGMEVVNVAPKEVPPLLSADLPIRGRPVRNLKGVTIEFRAPGSVASRQVHYFSVDATDKGLAHYPEFLVFLRSLAPTTTFIKSASYLLHGNEFLGVRSALLDISSVVVQDDSGFPYGMLERPGWQVQLYGRYDRPIKPFGGSFQVGLDRAYKAQAPASLPFTFGYQYQNFRDQRSNLMIAHRGLGRTAMIEPAASRQGAGR